MNKKEGKKASSIEMYISANVRFCRYLASRDLTGFSQLTSEIIKDFNEQGHHLTVEGKNAYNVTIRKFIFYLEDQEYIRNYFLKNAAPCKKLRNSGSSSHYQRNSIHRWNNTADTRTSRRIHT